VCECMNVCERGVGRCGCEGGLSFRCEKFSL